MIKIKTTKFSMPKIMASIMTFAAASCTQIPQGGAAPEGNGTFLVDDAKSCDVVEHSGALAATLGNGGLKGIVAAVTTDASYSSSALWALDAATDRLCPVSSGEAGDLFMTSAGDGLALFSRHAPELNYSVFTSVGRTTQQATPFAGNGDPHALRVFRDGSFVRWLIALNTAGKLVEFDPSAPREGVAVVPADFRQTSVGSSFRPVDLIVVKGEELLEVLVKASGGKAEDDYVFALHQGLDAYYRGNNTQAIYGWRRIGPGQYVEIDLNGSKPGVNGLPLRFTNPSGFLRNGNRVSMVSLCFSADPNCKKGIEYLDVIEFGYTAETRVATDFAATTIFTNGATVGGRPEKANSSSNDKPVSMAFSSVQTSSGKKIASIDLASGVVQTIHTFDAASSGFYGLAFDQASSNLLVGDSDGKNSLMWVYPIGTNGKASGNPARYILASPGQTYPMQFVLLNKN